MKLRHSALQLALAPVLLRQGKAARARALKLPEATGPREGRIGSGPRLRLLIVGDSSAAGVGVASQDLALAGRLVATLAQDYDVEWRLIAKTGATTAGTLQHLQQAERFVCDIAVTALGVNDITRGTSLASWLAAQRELWHLLQNSYGAHRILVSGFPPVRHFPLLPQPLRWVLGRQAEAYDRKLRSVLATRPECEHVPLNFSTDPTLMAEDGFHPGPQIYARWADNVAARIARDWAY
jgi:lysophospholipase L1-like esterase